MSDLQVIHDPNLEMAAIVDLDTNMGWGPMCVGPNAADLLQAYVDGMPFDITILTQEQARDIFLSVFRDQAAAAVEASATPADNPVEPPTDPVATAAALSSTGPVEATGTVPLAQPADTDMAADASQTDTVTTPDPSSSPGTQLADSEQPLQGGTRAMANCLVCNANGQGSTNPACVVCGGTGKVGAAT